MIQNKAPTVVNNLDFLIGSQGLHIVKKTKPACWHIRNLEEKEYVVGKKYSFLFLSLSKPIFPLYLNDSKYRCFTHNTFLKYYHYK